MAFRCSLSSSALLFRFYLCFMDDKVDLCEGLRLEMGLAFLDLLVALVLVAVGFAGGPRSLR